MTTSPSQPAEAPLLGGLQEISEDVRLRALAAITQGLTSGTGSGEELVRIVAELFGKTVQFTQGQTSNALQVGVQEGVSQTALTPEAKNRLLQTLEKRFYMHPERHRSAVKWENFCRALEADPEHLWSVNEMEKAGHEPDLYLEDMNAYYIGTCCKESREAAGGMDIAYDAEAIEWLRQNRPKVVRDGNAVDMAAAMKTKLFPQDHFLHLQLLGEFDSDSTCFVDTPEDVRKKNEVLAGSWNGDGDGNVFRPTESRPAEVYPWLINTHLNLPNGLRCYRRIPKVRSPH